MEGSPAFPLQPTNNNGMGLFLDFNLKNTDRVSKYFTTHQKLRKASHLNQKQRDKQQT